MIGAMPAVAVRHERRKNKTKDKPVRPTKLQVTTFKAFIWGFVGLNFGKKFSN